MKKVTLGRYPSSIKADDVNITKQLNENIYAGDDGETYKKLYDKYYRVELILDWSNTNQPVSISFARLAVLPHCNTSLYYCFVITAIHRKIYCLQVRSN